MADGEMKVARKHHDNELLGALAIIKDTLQLQ